MRIFIRISSFLSLVFFTANAHAGCDGTTTTLGSDCVHYQSTANGSYLDLLITKGRACEQAHKFLDDQSKAWAESHCIDKAWRPDRDAGRRACRNVEPLALATRGVRCLRGVNLRITDSFNYHSCQRSIQDQYTAVRHRSTGNIDLFINYNNRFRRQAEIIGECNGDSRTALERCTFAIRDYHLPQTDCACANGVCELKERLNAEAPTAAPATSTDQEFQTVEAPR